MLNVIPAGLSGWQTVGQTGPREFLPVISAQSTTPVSSLTDLLIAFVVSTLTGTSPTLQLIVEQLIAGQWQAVPGGAQAVVSATGTYFYLVRGGFGIPYRFRVVDGGTVTNANFTVSKWAATPVN